MRILIVLTLLPFLSIAQKTENTLEPEIHPIDLRNTTSNFEKEYLGTENIQQNAKDYLLRALPNLQAENSTIEETHFIESRGGSHITFEQYLNSKRVYRSQIKLTIDNKGYSKVLFDNSFAPPTPLDNEFPYQEMVNNWLINNTKQPDKKITEAVYFYNGVTLIPAARIEITEGDLYYEVILDNDGELIYHNDLLAYFEAPDSTVTATVFLPDPLTTAGVTYGNPYTDQSDANVTTLNNELESVTMKVNFTGGTFSLVSQHCEITEHSAPVVTPATSTTPDFSFLRADQGFEDVNVFYHINAFQQHIQNLGFNNLVNYAIHCDTHGVNGSDNSFFSSSTNPPQLTFGEGGVDDAEDADVVIHEYGHAISYSAAPNTNSGSERRALDEANGDYFASSYSRFLDPYKWENVFSWDGHNEFWSGRSSISNKTYPNDLVFNLYTDADIWSATLMQIWSDIGRDATDAIIMESMFGYASNMTMADAAYLLILADSTLFNGANHGEICSRTVARGLLNNTQCVVGVDEKVAGSNAIKLLNSASFTAGESAFLQLPTNIGATVSLFDTQGKLVWEKQITNNNQVEIKSGPLVSGSYLLQVKTNQLNKSFKLVK